MSWLWFLAITLIILGALGYIEQLFGFKWSRKTLGLLLGIYLLLSFGQWYVDNRERNQTQQSEEQLRVDLRSTQEQLTKAQQALREVEAHQGPWTLTAEQRRLLIQQLREGPPGPFEVLVAANDPKAEQFARQFDGVLKDAGWTRKKSGFGSTYLDEDYRPQFLEGLMIDLSRAELPPHGELLRRALHTAGLDVSIRIIPEVPETVVRLVVGHRPWPHNREVGQQEQPR